MHHIYIPQKRNKKKILKEFSKKKKKPYSSTYCIEKQNEDDTDFQLEQFK